MDRQTFEMNNGTVIFEDDKVIFKQLWLKDISCDIMDIIDYELVWNEKKLKGKLKIKIIIPYLSNEIVRCYLLGSATINEGKMLYNILCNKCNIKKECYDIPVQPIDEMTTFVFSCYEKTTVVLAENLIKITRAGASNAWMRGFAGEKIININDITAIQLRNPGKASAGYLQIRVPGGVEGNGLSSAFVDENAITFGPGEMKYVHAIKNYIEEKIKNKSIPQDIQAIDIVEEIRKYKDLLDENLITQEEFDAKKKQLLDL